MLSRLVLCCALAGISSPAVASERPALDLLIAHHARAHGVPIALVHRVVQRESGYNPRASSRGNLGLMQIRYDTARGMGYSGPPAGLLDANTNLTFAVPYLANAYRVAGGNPDRAVSLYSGGYYYVAKSKGMLGQLRKANTVPVTIPETAPPASVSSYLSHVFALPPATR